MGKPELKALGVDLTKFVELRQVAEAVSKDSLVGDYLLKASMGKPELIYFNGPGRGQLTRLAFAAANVEFTDTRIQQKDWPNIKADPNSVPAQCFGSIPCIKHGDLLLAQSEATATYAAKLGLWPQGRLGSTEEEQAINRATE